jgi:uracil-DNA glycosylase family 4
MKFDELKQGILNCSDCTSLFGFNPVPIIHGEYNSKIVQISQAPSKNVHITGKPFNDKTGKKLINEWYEIHEDLFYDKSNFYITSMAHCYPGKNKNGGDKLPPIHCTKKWLTRELDIIQNEIYIIIGARAANFLFPEKSFYELVFNNQFINLKPAFILPHPSPLNIKWFKDNPEFYNKRLKEIRENVHLALGVLKLDEVAVFEY